MLHLSNPIRTLLASVIFFMVATPLQAEYRAYLLEVFDHISEKRWEATTGFSPDKYVNTHGGGNRLSVFTKATWVCYGDTSTFTAICEMPKPIKPRFKVGERVKITLEKHVTQGWMGVVELAYYQAGVKSNVYGIRFGDKRQLYNRYFEFNLEKFATNPVATSQATQPAQPQQPENQPAQAAENAQPAQTAQAGQQ